MRNAHAKFTDTMTKKHFDLVDLEHINVIFKDDRTHRAALYLPFIGRNDARTLCVIGQNPSAADENIADNTVHFLEKYIYTQQTQYSAILMLNLYSRIDTYKEEIENLNHPECEHILLQEIEQNSDFLVVFGKLGNQGAYRFTDRVRAIKPFLDGKNVYKFDINTNYAPHPGNPTILYRNMDIGMVPYDFSDLVCY